LDNRVMPAVAVAVAGVSRKLENQDQYMGLAAADPTVGAAKAGLGLAAVEVAVAVAQQDKLPTGAAKPDSDWAATEAGQLDLNPDTETETRQELELELE